MKSNTIMPTGLNKGMF